MITVEADFSPLARRVDELLERINQFKRVDVGQGLDDWQKDDMNRQHPRTKVFYSRGRASTTIYPHSIGEVKRSRQAQLGFRRLQKQLAKPRKRAYAGQYLKYRTYRRWSTRPILRAELYTALDQRMSELLAEKIHW